MIEKIVYFDKPGMINTDETLRLAKERAVKYGIKTIIITSTTGISAEKALRVFREPEYKIIAMSWFKDKFSKKTVKHYQKRRHHVIFLSEVNSSNDIRGIAKDGNQALRRVCEGFRAAVDIALKAVNLGLVPEKKELIAIAGTGRGWDKWKIPYRGGGGVDTAIIIEPTKIEEFLKERPLKDNRRDIKEIICKPR